MAISPQRLTIYLYSAHRAVIFAIAQLSCNFWLSFLSAIRWAQPYKLNAKVRTRPKFNLTLD